MHQSYLNELFEFLLDSLMFIYVIKMRLVSPLLEFPSQLLEPRIRHRGPFSYTLNSQAVLELLGGAINRAILQTLKLFAK